MKKIIFTKVKYSLLLFFLLYYVNGFSQYPTSGIVGCYPFSGSANDYSGHNYNGTVSNATLTTDRFNRASNAYNFNGFNSRIELNVNYFQLPYFTYSVWVKASAYPSNGNVYRIISVGSMNGEQDLCLYNNYGGRTGWGFSGTNSGGWSVGSLPTLNTWYHLVVTRAATEMRFYINGQFVGNSTYSNSQASYGTMGTKRAIIGAHYDFSQYFNGVIDDIHIYNRALTAAEITLLYSGGPNAVTITANPGTILCVGESVTFTAVVGYIQNPIYQWQVNGVVVGDNSPTYTTNTITNGSVVRCLVFPQSNDCEVPVYSNSLTIVVVTSLPITVTITASPGDTICKGDTVKFTAVGNNGGSNPVYQWKINGIDVGTNQPTLTVDTLSNGARVNCLLTSSAPCATNNPATSNTIIMVVDEKLPLKIVITASPSNNICIGDTVTFHAVGEHGGSNVNYQWKVNGNNVGGNQQTIAFDTLKTGDIVKCVYSSTSTCVSNNPATSNQIVMTVSEIKPLDFQITANPGTIICKGINVQFIAEIIGSPADSVVCQWKINGKIVGSTSDTLEVDTLSDKDIVSCKYNAINGCFTNNPATKEIQMTVYPKPTIEAGDSLDIGISEGITINTTYEGGTPPYQFNWTPESGLSDPHSSAPYATPTETTEYFIEITDVNGCKCMDSVLVSIYDFETTFFVPNIFSPNGDQQNDVLYVRGKGIQELQFIVYDRWGKQVFSTTTQDKGWDGTFNGKALNPATFIYYIRVKTYDGKSVEKKGNVTLVK